VKFVLKVFIFIINFLNLQFLTNIIMFFILNPRFLIIITRFLIIITRFLIIIIRFFILIVHILILNLNYLKKNYFKEI